MQIQRKKWTVKLCAAAMCLSLFGSMPSYAGSWYTDEFQKWHYMNDKNANATGWIFDGEWYFLDESGTMLSRAWVLHKDGTWYYLGDSGAMQRNAWIEGAGDAWYYVGSDGRMAVSAMTPDGYTVGKDGAWIASIPRAEKAVTAAPKASGGGSGGSSSGGRGSGSKGDSSSTNDGTEKVPELQGVRIIQKKRKRNPSYPRHRRLNIIQQILKAMTRNVWRPIWRKGACSNLTTRRPSMPISNRLFTVRGGRQS